MKYISKTVFVFCLSLFCANCFAQINYYKINGGITINEKDYLNAKEKLFKYGKVEEFYLKTITKTDSIINYVRLANLVTTADGFDPWGEAKKMIGTKFKIEKFKDNNSNNFNSDLIDGKPTFINFWFTKCPPCISELPTLDKLKNKYEDRVNFIGVTFENQKEVDKFLKKHKFEFKHITNSKKQINDLKISGYPTSFILDKNGIIKIITPEITEFQIKDIETILNILL